MAGKSGRYLVYRDDTLILEVQAEPGPLISKLAPPPLPGEQPVFHPFLTATFHAPQEEALLHTILQRAQSVDEFLAALGRAGFRVESQS
jgi:hypothetical protein